MFEVFELGNEERDRRWRKVREAMEKRGLGALVVYGAKGMNLHECTNYIYLTNIPSFGFLAVPGYLVLPFEGEPTIVGFAKLPGEHFWVNDIRGKYPSFSKVITDRLRELHLEGAKIGIVSTKGYYGEVGFPHATYMQLQEDLPKAQFEDATDIVAEVRIIKSDAEIRCFEIGCEAANKAMQAVVDTAKPGVRDYEVKAAILDALVRNGCEPDALFLYGSGKELIHGGDGQFLHPRYLRTLEKGDIIHMEFDASYNGYAAQHNQPFSIGEPDKEWRNVFDVAVKAFNTGFKTLKPGITIGELDKAMLSVIKENGYQSQNCTFHGLSLTTEEPMASTTDHQMPLGSSAEPPSCLPDNSFILQTGMVLEFEPHVIQPDRKKGLTLGCPVLVTGTGCRLLNKSWQPEFKVAKYPA